MRRSYLAVCGVVGVAMASCSVLDIIAPDTATIGASIPIRVSLGRALGNGLTYSFCARRPTGWVITTPTYTLEREPPMSGSLATVNAADTDALNASASMPGSTWTCFDGPAAAVSGDRGFVDLQMTVTSAGTHLLELGMRVHETEPYLVSGSHNIVVNGTPRYDQNLLAQGSIPPHLAIAYGSGRFVMVGDDDLVLVEENGTRTEYDSGLDESLSDVAFGEGKFIAVGTNRTVLSSADGITWSGPLAPHVTDVQLNTVFRGATRFIAAGEGPILQSADGVTWSDAASDGLDPALQWANGAASATTEVLIDIDGTVIAVSENGGPFVPRALSGVASQGALAYAPSVGWVFGRAGGAFRSADLVTFTAVDFGPASTTPRLFSAGGAVYGTDSSWAYRITASEAIVVGTHSSAMLRDAAEDGKRAVVLGSLGILGESFLLSVDLPRLALDLTGLTFSTAGEEKTFAVRNDGLGLLRVTALQSSGGSTATGCAAALAANESCTVTVTLNDADNPGTVTVVTNGAFEASAVVTLTFAPAPVDASGADDDGCAAAPGSPLFVLLALVASRRRSLTSACPSSRP